MNTAPAPLRYAIVLALAAAGPLTSCATDPVRPRSDPFTMPIRASEGYIVHEVWLNGQGPFWAVLDTGNAQTIVFERVAEQLGLDTDPLGEMGGAGPGTIEVRATRDLPVTLRGDDDQEVSFVDPVAIVLPETATLPDFEGRRIDAFLGASMIERYATTIDYPAGRLRLRDHASYTAPADAQVMAIELTEGFPHFEGRVVAQRAGADTDPVEGHFLLDLGAAYTVQVDFELADARGLLAGDDPDRRVEGKIMGIDGVMMDILSVPASSVEIGGATLDLPRVLLLPVPGGGPPIDGLVGNVGSGCFRSGALTLDYPGRRVIFAPVRE